MKILWLSTTSTNAEPVIGSLESLNLKGPIEIFRYDQTDSVQQKIFEKVHEYEPQLVLYISTAGGAHMPPDDTFSWIRHHAPIVHICFDAACPNWHPILERYLKLESFTLTVNIDGSHNWPQGPKDLTTLCPIDPRPYQEQIPKTVNLGFCGGDGSESRRKIIGALNPILTRRVREETVGSYSEYAKFMKSSKMVVNMALCGSERATQVKARVVEAGLAKCCLLEEQGSATARWFVPGMDYLEYRDPEELIKIVERISHEPYTIKKHATHLHNKIIMHHSPRVFWKRVFDAI